MSPSIRFSRLPFALAVLLGPLCAHAQWSSDPAVNLIVADAGGGQTQPKIVTTADGGYYVSWLDNHAAGFDIHLQRLDALGNALWAHDGVLVADRDYGFTYDYGLATDAAGNAYISFNCCENNSPDEHIVVSKVLPDGALDWGADGVTVSTPASTEAVYNTFATTTTDGDVVVAWTADTGIRAQKLDADGAPQWAANGVLLEQPSGVKLLADIEPAQGGDAIVSWSNQAGSSRILRAQKLAGADGGASWNGGSAVQVFGQGNLQAGYFPTFVADGAGGGVFHDYDAVGNAFTARVQHLDAAGTPLLDADGVVATTDDGIDHSSTEAAFDAATGDIYVIWRDNYTTDAGQTFDGVSAQRIDAGGQRRWTDTGKVLVPPTDSTDGTASISQLTALRAPDGFVGGWSTGAIPAADQPITITRLDGTGDYVWPTQTVAVKTRRYSADSVATLGADGSFVYAWQDGDDGAGASTIRAQNVTLDGSLGHAPDDVVFADGFDD